MTDLQELQPLLWLIDTIWSWSTADDMSRVKSQNGMSLEVSHIRILSNYVARRA